VLTAVGVEGCVPGAKRRRGVVDGELDQQHEFLSVVCPLAGKGAQHVGNDAVDVLDLAGRVVVVRRAEDERGTERCVQPGPEGAGEAYLLSLSYCCHGTRYGREIGRRVLVLPGLFDHALDHSG
jgi:hypothetical protein